MRSEKQSALTRLCRTADSNTLVHTKDATICTDAVILIKRLLDFGGKLNNSPVKAGKDD